MFLRKAKPQRDRTGIDRQQDYINGHVARYNLQVSQTASNIRVSGAHVQDSPDFNVMLSKLANPDIDGVVTATNDLTVLSA